MIAGRLFLSGPTVRVLPGAADPAIVAYLRELDSRLDAPRRARADVLAEIGDGLTEALRGHQAHGLPPGEATAEAITEFGDPGAVAAAFGEEFAARRARRAALTVVRTGPVAGFLWLAAYAASSTPPWRLGPGQAVTPALVMAAAIGLAILATGAAALATVLLTGRLSRLPEFRPGATAFTAGVTSLAANAADLCALGLFAWWAIGPATSPAWLPVVPAVAASAGRLFLAHRAAHRFLRPRPATA